MQVRQLNGMLVVCMYIIYISVCLCTSLLGGMFVPADAGGLRARR